MKKITLLYAESQPETLQLVPHLSKLLQHYGYESYLINITDKEQPILDSELKASKMMIVLGGDGSILHAAHLEQAQGTPILGINFGRVGYLTELEPDELEQELPYYLNGDKSIWIDERSMLQATIANGEEQQEFQALNDIMIARGTWPRGVYVRTWIDELFFDTFYGDGLILSTATGSTAYNISVGGPILHPKIEGCILTPIAPHLASNRAVVIPLQSTIQLQIATNSQDGVFSADGQWNCELKDGAVVTIQKSPNITRFIRRKPRTHFYQVIRGHQNDGEDKTLS
ncbi:NAD kinase [Dictyobacter alpinus]|uniref:NAD kinase n=1 Tax=Dictyobacter alpinus TaxID=2014873 RepID=A0A402BGN9_9CHLR|nr:NAD(+)/NADH kinase [Dictyobacter alpinus]GCE30584.1 NAD kinase [Dictyobacter alpinus]